MTTRARRGGLLLMAAAAAMSLAACGPQDEPGTGSSTSARSERTGTGATTAPRTGRNADLGAMSTTALRTLAGIPVKGRAAKTGYSRDMFGRGWSDDVDVEFGHNGCDTRNDILRRDLTGVVSKAGTRDCIITAGTLRDPYTGKTISFARGEKSSQAVQIDHVVALSDAWQKGAQQLSSGERRAFANDPRNLLAVDGPTNQSKSDGDAATWLPPNRSYRCTYVARQIEVKAAYRLWVTSGEKTVMERLLTGCGGTAPAVAPGPTAASEPARRTQPPTSTQTTAQPVTTQTTERPAPRPTTPRQMIEPPSDDSSAYYPNCTAVRDAGKSPLLRGQPGYSSKLDRDGDGVACE
ncbi:MAG: DUF1524 domain-containing protein [Gordonia sp. (in: high G+C Gram-positive bacteria)]|uniref:GmrSD restriction endonuclease domain-containing protein n=1 Tax=Gordonia sp. (in: high G+C Gram-positive bacteria) TaxID=84139 RepID=UPI0039E58226